MPKCTCVRLRGSTQHTLDGCGSTHAVRHVRQGKHVTRVCTLVDVFMNERLQLARTSTNVGNVASSAVQTPFDVDFVQH